MRSAIAAARAIVAAATVASFAAPAAADPLADVVRAKLAPLPPGLGVVAVHLAPAQNVDVAPAIVALEPPAEVRRGRASVRVYVKGKVMWVPVTFGAIARVAVARHAIALGDTVTAADIALEDRATDVDRPAAPDDLIGASAVRAIADGAVVTARDVALPPPVPRGTAVEVVVQRGAIKVRGTGTLELAARTGQPASVRLAGNRQVVHGTLLASHVVVVGVAP